MKVTHLSRACTICIYFFPLPRTTSLSFQSHIAFSRDDWSLTAIRDGGGGAASTTSLEHSSFSLRETCCMATVKSYYNHCPKHKLKKFAAQTYIKSLFLAKGKLWKCKTSVDHKNHNRKIHNWSYVQLTFSDVVWWLCSMTKMGNKKTFCCNAMGGHWVKLEAKLSAALVSRSMIHSGSNSDKTWKKYIETLTLINMQTQKSLTPSDIFLVTWVTTAGHQSHTFFTI